MLKVVGHFFVSQDTVVCVPPQEFTTAVLDFMLDKDQSDPLVYKNIPAQIFRGGRNGPMVSASCWVMTTITAVKERTLTVEEWSKPTWLEVFNKNMKTINIKIFTESEFEPIRFKPDGLPILGRQPTRTWTKYKKGTLIVLGHLFAPQNISPALYPAGLKKMFPLALNRQDIQIYAIMAREDREMKAALNRPEPEHQEQQFDVHSVASSSIPNKHGRTVTEVQHPGRSLLSSLSNHQLQVLSGARNMTPAAEPGPASGTVENRMDTPHPTKRWPPRLTWSSVNHGVFPTNMVIEVATGNNVQQADQQQTNTEQAAPQQGNSSELAPRPMDWTNIQQDPSIHSIEDDPIITRCGPVISVIRAAQISPAAPAPIAPSTSRAGHSNTLLKDLVMSDTESCSSSPGEVPALVRSDLEEGEITDEETEPIRGGDTARQADSTPRSSRPAAPTGPRRPQPSTGDRLVTDFGPFAQLARVNNIPMPLSPNEARQKQQVEDFNKIFVQATSTSRPGKAPTPPKKPKKRTINFKITPISKKVRTDDPEVDDVFNEKEKKDKRGKEKNKKGRKPTTSSDDSDFTT